MCLHRIERLMRVHGLRARPRRRGLPKDDGLRSVIADNILDRQFTAEAPNQRWIADFTYIWTAEGWLYVAVVIDLFSRRRMVDERHHDRSARDRCADDGDLATKARRPAASLGPGQPIHERAVPAVDGRQWRHLLDEPVGQRLGQRGNGELLLVDEDRTDRRSISAITRRPTCSINRAYNPTRRHSTLGYLSPMDFERQAM